MSAPEAFQPEAVVRPRSPAEVAAALREVRSAGRRAVPLGRGGGMGPLPPQEPYVLLSLEELTGVEEHEPGDLTFTARAGTTLGRLAETLDPHAQWLPVEPPGGPARTLGGLAATGLGGALHGGYGSVRDQVLGLSLVTGDGRLLRLGGRVMKNVAGFDLVRLVVGSRGRLGVVVSVSMRLFPSPRGERVLVLDERDPEELLAGARAVATAPMVPASAVLAGGPGADAAGALVVRLQGPASTLDADQETLERSVGRSFRALEGGGEEAVSLLAALRDRGTGGALAFRQAGLPAELPARWRRLRQTLPQAELRADVLAGRIRGSLGEADAQAVEAARHVGVAAGRPVLFTALAPGLRGLVQPWKGPEDGGLGERLRARFDPEGVLASGELGR